MDLSLEAAPDRARWGTRLGSLGERGGEEDCERAFRPLCVPGGGQARSRAASPALHADGAVTDDLGRAGRSLGGIFSHSARHTVFPSIPL